MDHCIGQVIKKLKALGIYKNTLLIVTSVHGEGRGDHGEEQHGYYVYQSCIHVPLIIKSPGKAKNQRVGDTVGLIDLVPTICGQLGIAPPEPCTGVDLGGYLDHEPVQNERYLYSESLLPTRFGCSPLMSVVNDRWKYIQAPRAELYNLSEDPGELTNLIATEEKRARLYKDTLKLMVQEQVRAKEAATDFKLDASGRAKLESMGDVAGHSVTEDFEFDETKDDPKDWFSIYQKIGLVRSFLKVDKFDRMEKECLGIIEERPEYILAYYYLADAQYKLKKYDKAINNANEFLFRVEEKQAGRSQDNTPLSDNLRHQADVFNIVGMCYAETNNIPNALGAYNKALGFASEDMAAQVHYNIGNVSLNQQDFEEAIGHYQKALGLNPELAEAHLNAGIASMHQDRFDAARGHFETALALRPGWDLAKQNLAFLDRKETLLGAIARYQTLLEAKPDQPEVLQQLASAHYLLGDKAAAIDRWTTLLALAPDSKRRWRMA